MEGITYPNGMSPDAMGLPERMRLASNQGVLFDKAIQRDRLNRVTRVSDREQTLAYHYDKEGRLLKALNNRSEESESFHIDANDSRLGNLIQGTCPGGNAKFTFTDLNRLKSISLPQGRARYGYGAFGRRVAKKVNGITTRYVWAQSRILHEAQFDNNNAPLDAIDYLYFPQSAVLLGIRHNRTIHWAAFGESVSGANLIGSTVGGAIDVAAGQMCRPKAGDKTDGVKPAQVALNGGVASNIGGTVVAVQDSPIVGAPTTAMAAATLPAMDKTGFLAGAGASAAEQCAQLEMNKKGIDTLSAVKQALADGVTGAGSTLPPLTAGTFTTRKLPGIDLQYQPALPAERTAAQRPQKKHLKATQPPEVMKKGLRKSDHSDIKPLHGNTISFQERPFQSSEWFRSKNQ